MSKTLLTYSFTLVSILICDFIWLSLMMPIFYKPRMQHLLTESVSWGPALVFYPLYAFGIYFFVIQPALRSTTTLWEVFFSGALFGLIAYGTYDLTNQVSLKGWTLELTLVDMAWGTLVAAFISTLTIFIFKR